MPFIGNQPALSYTSFAKQDFTTSATTSYTLSQPVANENEIALFINFVRQEPTTAYTASGTSLTLTSATSASDDMYAVFIGKAVQTVNPPAGSVDSSKINYPLTTFSSTGIDDNATSTAITIDSNEVVRIGNTSDTYSPTYTEHMVIGNYNADEDHGITFLSDLDNTFTLGFADDGHSTLRGAIKYSHLNDFMTFHAFADAERMRITKTGDVLVGKTTTSGNTEGISLTPTGNSNFVADEASTLLLNRLGNTGDILNFRQGSGNNVGSISVTASATAYNTSSDYRLKENVNYDFDATSRLKQLKPARFNFIADANTTVDGFLAHEVQDIVPEAIHGTKDAMRTEEYEVTPAVLDENGNVITEAVMGTREVPDYQGIDQSKLVPLLVKTIQELETRITALENN